MRQIVDDFALDLRDLSAKPFKEGELESELDSLLETLHITEEDDSVPTVASHLPFATQNYADADRARVSLLLLGCKDTDRFANRSVEAGFQNRRVYRQKSECAKRHRAEAIGCSEKGNW